MLSRRYPAHWTDEEHICQEESKGDKEHDQNLQEVNNLISCQETHTVYSRRTYDLGWNKKERKNKKNQRVNRRPKVAKFDKKWLLRAG